jgi:chromosome segregation ATPase
VKDIDKYERAIQQIAGARIRNIVVGSHLIARDLLQNKCTYGRENFVPLNKISAYIIGQDKV